MTKHIAILESESGDSDSSDSVVHVPYVKPPPPLISLDDSDDDNKSSSSARGKASKPSKATNKQRKSKDKTKSPTKTTPNTPGSSRSRLDNVSSHKSEMSMSKIPAKQSKKRCSSDKQSASAKVVQGNLNQGTINSETEQMEIGNTNRNVKQGFLIPSSRNVISKQSSSVSNDVNVQVPGETTDQTTVNTNNNIGLSLNNPVDCPIQITISNSIFETPPTKPKRKRTPNPNATTQRKMAMDFERFLKEINLPVPKALTIPTRGRKKRTSTSAAATISDSMLLSLMPIVLGDPNEINLQEHDVEPMDTISNSLNNVVQSIPDSTVHSPTSTAPDILIPAPAPIPDSSPSTSTCDPAVASSQAQGVVNITNEPSPSTSKCTTTSKKKYKSSKAEEEEPGFSAQDLKSVNSNTILTNILTDDTPPDSSNKGSKKQGRKKEAKNPKSTPRKPKSKSPTKRKRSSPILDEEEYEEYDPNVLWGADHDSNTLIVPPQHVFPGLKDEELYFPQVENFPPNWTPEMKEFYGTASPEGLGFEFRKIMRRQSSSRKLWKAPLDDGLPSPKRKRFWCHRCRNSHEPNDCHKQGPKICGMCGGKKHFSNYCPNRICLNCGASSTSQQGNMRFPVGCRSCTWNKKLPPCSICKVSGHTEHLCPDNWRRYHSTTIYIPEVIEEFEAMKSDIDMAKANWKFYQSKKRILTKKIDGLLRKLQNSNPGTFKHENTLLSAQTEMTQVLNELKPIYETLETFKSKVEEFKKQVYPPLVPRRKVHSYCCNCTKLGHRYFQCEAPRLQESRNFHPHKPYVIREIAATLSSDETERINDILEIANFDLDLIDPEALEEEVATDAMEVDENAGDEDEAASNDTREESPEVEIIEANVVPTTNQLEKLKTSSAAPLLVSGHMDTTAATTESFTHEEAEMFQFKKPSVSKVSPVQGPSVPLFSSFESSRPSLPSSNKIFSQDVIEPNFDVDERIIGPNIPIQPVFLAPSPQFPIPPLIPNPQQLPPPSFGITPQDRKIPILLYVSPEELHHYAPVPVSNGGTAFLPPPIPQFPGPILQPAHSSMVQERTWVASKEIPAAPDSTTPPKTTPEENQFQENAAENNTKAFSARKWNDLKIARIRLITYLETELSVKIKMSDDSIRITEGNSESRKIARRNMEKFLQATSDGTVTKFIPDLSKEPEPDNPEIIELNDVEEEEDQQNAGVNFKRTHRPHNYERYDNQRWNQDRPHYGEHERRYDNYNNRGRGRQAHMHPYRRPLGRDSRPGSNQYYNNNNNWDRDSHASRRDDRGGPRPSHSQGSGRPYNNHTSPRKDVKANRPRRYYDQD